MPQPSLDEETKARYERLFRLYKELKQEFESLEKEGHEIVGELRTALDHKKKEQVLKNIKGDK